MGLFLKLTCNHNIRPLLSRKKETLGDWEHWQISKLDKEHPPSKTNSSNENQQKWRCDAAINQHEL